MIPLKKQLAFSLLVLAVLISCDKGERPIPKSLPGNAIVQQIELTEKYKNQVYFSLEENKVIATNLKTDWDLSFSRTAYEPRITINSSKAMRVHRTKSDFSEITAYAGDDWKYDAHSGNLDTTAFGSTLLNYTFIVDRGYNENGDLIGSFKLKVLAFNDEKYNIQYGKLSETSGKMIEINRNTDQNFTYFQLENGSVDIAPPSEKWDLLFTQYTHLFSDPFTPYLVTGVLINRENTTVYETELMDFETVTKEVAESLSYSDAQNTIGYDWKYFDFDASSFIIDPTMVFIIKNQNGFYYKLHFIDYYNNAGLKGFPKFEFQQL